MAVRSRACSWEAPASLWGAAADLVAAGERIAETRRAGSASQEGRMVYVHAQYWPGSSLYRHRRRRTTRQRWRRRAEKLFAGRV